MTNNNPIREKELLKILKSAKSAPWAQPSAEFRQNARIRLLNSIAAKAEKQTLSQNYSFGQLLSFRFAAVFGVILLFLFTGTVALAQSSVPGEFLYPLKIASEKALLAITPSGDLQDKLAQKFARRRLSENQRAEEVKGQKTINGVEPADNNPDSNERPKPEKETPKTDSEGSFTEELQNLQDGFNNLINPQPQNPTAAPTPQPEPQVPLPSIPPNSNILSSPSPLPPLPNSPVTNPTNDATDNLKKEQQNIPLPQINTPVQIPKL